MVSIRANKARMLNEKKEKIKKIAEKGLWKRTESLIQQSQTWFWLPRITTLFSHKIPVFIRPRDNPTRCCPFFWDRMRTKD